MALYSQRKQRLDPMHTAALEVRSAYYNDITLPIPEMDRNEKPLVANLLYATGEQKAQRVASTQPSIYYPSTDPGAPRAESRSSQRRDVTLSWWEDDRMKLKLRKRARHLVYYAASPVMLRPNFTEHRPTWQIRNPLSALGPDLDVGELCPEDIIFTYAKSYAWLARRYPNHVLQFGNEKDVCDGVFSILEYQDADDTVLLAVGDKVDRARPSYMEPLRTTMIVELERAPNRVGRCTAIMAGSIGLEHARGSYDGMLGMWQAMGKIMALEAIGMQRAIWPEEWLIDDPNGDGASIVTHADPLHGITGHVTGGKLETIVPQLNQGGERLMDRLERGMRIDAGMPPELGGESGSNIRTGRRGDQILSAVMDFPLQEFQEILAVSLEEENKVAIAIDKAYFPTAKTIVLSPTGGEFEYDALKLWETDVQFVRYAHAGVDAQGLVIEGAQRIGTGTLSKRSFMEMDPLVEDPQSELDRITVEHMRDALLNGVSAMAQDPQMAPVIAQILQHARQSGVEIEDAVIEIHASLQQMQAQQAALAQQQQMGGPAGLGGPTPEGQPGMSEPIPSIASPPQGVQNLAGLLSALKKGPPAAVAPSLGAPA